MLNRYREKFSIVLKAMGEALVKAGFKAWHLTLLGFIITILAGLILFAWQSLVGEVSSGLLYMLAGLMDSLDGTVARLRREVSQWGGFIDAYLDRVEEAIYVISLIPSVVNPNPILAITFISLSFLISYSRAKAEEFKIKLRGIGLMERAERMIVLGIGVILSPLIHIDIVFIVLIILCLYTVLERLWRVYQATHSSLTLN